jgi:hypothetical protein
MLNVLNRIFDIGRKIIIIIAVYVFVVGLFLYFINQDKPKVTIDPVKRNRDAIYKVINDPQYNRTKEGKIAISIYRSISCVMMGEACTNNLNDGDKNYRKSLFGTLTKLIVLPYQNPPASGIYWVYSGLQNAGFIPKTYAAEGIGFAGLRPLMNLWKVFRDLAYMILVLILIAIGFMIMFRMKLNPQTVISVENALPKIVIALILITFSFAIAGFLIDLMYILMTLGIAIMSNRGNFFNITEFQNRYLNAGFDTIWFSLFPIKSTSTPFGGGLGGLMTLGQSFMNMLPDFLNQILRVATGTMMIFVMPNLFKPLSELADALGRINVTIPIASAIPPIFSTILRPVIALLLMIFAFFIGYNALPFVFFVLVSISIIAMFFRLFFLLLFTYLRILLMIIFAPLFMLFEAMPGKSAFSYWFKQILSEILVFPVVVVLLIVAYIIVNSPSTVGNLWAPPFMVDSNPNAFSILLGFAIMFQIPDFVKLIKELLGVKDMPIGLNLGTFFGGAAGVGGAGMGLLGQVGSLSLAAGAFGKNLDLSAIARGEFKGILTKKGAGP